MIAFPLKGTCGQYQPGAPGALGVTYRGARSAWVAGRASVPWGAHGPLVSWWSHGTWVPLHAWKPWFSLFALWASVSWNSLITLIKENLIKRMISSRTTVAVKNKGSGFILEITSCGSLDK